MVDDLDDGDFVQPRNALVGLVVIHENHPHGRRLGERTLQHRAHEPPRIVHDREVVVGVAHGGELDVVHGIRHGENLRAAVQGGLRNGDRKVGLGDEKPEQFRRGQHADELAVGVADGQARLAARLQLAERVLKAHVRLDHRNGRVNQVADAQVDVALHANRRQTEVVEHPRRLLGQTPRANGLDFRHARAAAQVRQRIGARNRIDVGIPVPANVCLHPSPLHLFTAATAPRVRADNCRSPTCRRSRPDAATVRR